MKKLLGLTLSTMLAVAPAVAMAQQQTASMPQQSGGTVAGQSTFDNVPGGLTGVVVGTVVIAGVVFLVVSVTDSGGGGGTTTTLVPATTTTTD